MFIVTEAWWPPGKSAEVAKLYLEVMKKYPNDKTIGKPITVAVWPVKDGMHSITIDSIKLGKVKESIDLAGKRLLMLGSIEGYVYQFNIAYDLVEAMPLVGLTAPE